MTDWSRHACNVHRALLSFLLIDGAADLLCSCDDWATPKEQGGGYHPPPCSSDYLVNKIIVLGKQVMPFANEFITAGGIVDVVYAFFITVDQVNLAAHRP